MNIEPFKNESLLEYTYRVLDLTNTIISMPKLREIYYKNKK